MGVTALVYSVTACSAARRPSAEQEARIERAEMRDVDHELQRDQRVGALVDRYHIEDEVLTVLVDAAAWKRLRASGQDAFKRTLWSPWHASYVRHHPGTTERVFLKVEDMVGNDLGSYFET